MVTFNWIIISIKYVFTSNLTFAPQFEISKKMSGISLYWIAAQQKASTCRRQKSHSIYSKFRVEENELTLRFQYPQKVAKKLQKSNKARKP